MSPDSLNTKSETTRIEQFSLNTKSEIKRIDYFYRSGTRMSSDSLNTKSEIALPNIALKYENSPLELLSTKNPKTPPHPPPHPKKIPVRESQKKIAALRAAKTIPFRHSRPCLQ